MSSEIRTRMIRLFSFATERNFYWIWSCAADTWDNRDVTTEMLFVVRNKIPSKAIVIQTGLERSHFVETITAYAFYG